MTAAISNSVPIFGTYPGWVQGGNLANIELEIFFDYLCWDSKTYYPLVKAALDTPVEGDTTWMDAVTLKLSSFPLDYHIHSWQVAQVLPGLLDLCVQDETQCLMDKYLDFSFEMQDHVLSLSDYSKDEFIPYWAQQVADELGLPYEGVLGIYDRDTDVHKTEDKTRAIWKYGAARGVSGTPTAFINGVKLDSFPDSTQAWIDTLQAVLDAQWNPETQQATFFQ